MADFSISGWVDEPMKADWRISIKDYRKKIPALNPHSMNPFIPTTVHSRLAWRRISSILSAMVCICACVGG